ncbi:DNA-binding protein RFX5 [Eumeta japonica]|uniref:DNA-binding protein RFX5 n=1 Tax=Eumeta variegata TaxID=151549 RepID=A0A4C1YWL5_EUMVA|nr:DNA-binding protein RFX5 [Eumeta japonica]
MDSSTPFQPWTAKDSTKNVKTERESVGDAKLHQENVNHSKHTQTASHGKETVVLSRPVPGSSSMSNPDAPDTAATDTMDASKITSLQLRVEKTLSPECRQRVSQLLEAVESLSVPERLFLYLRLPTGIPPHDPLKQPVNPLGSRAELQQTVTWIQTHLEVDPDVSLPKQDVYDEYIAYCMSSNMKPLSTADFGKVMKQVYPSVRPRRLGTRGNSRYCYAGLRKKVKLEVPQLPDLSEASKDPESKDEGAEKIVCEWAEIKLGIKFNNLLELSRHLLAIGSSAPAVAVSSTPPPLMTIPQVMGGDDSSRQLMKQLKRKIQTQSTPGRPKKNKAQELTGEPPPSTSYAPPLALKHESEHLPEPSYGFQPGYLYEVRAPYAPYSVPPRAHPPHATPHPMPPVHTAMHEYRPDPYIFESPYAGPRDLSVPSEATHNVPINLSSDASLDLSTERTEWPRRRPPEPPPARLPLPGKKLILETYQSETQGGSPRPLQTESRASSVAVEEFPRTEYLPKKMRAAEILGGKLAAARQTLFSDAPPTSSITSETSARPETTFLEDPKNVASRSKSTAAALVREEQKAASPAQSVKAPMPKADTGRKKKYRVSSTPDTAPPSPDACCGFDGISLRTGVICEEKHSEILNRERVISICNMDKHALDDYLNEGSSQEHEEELLQYFQRDEDHDSDRPIEKNATDNVTFLDPGLDPQDDHSQGKNEKLSQLRELLAKNLKNQSGSSAQILGLNQESQLSSEHSHEPALKPVINEGAFKPVYGSDNINGQTSSTENESHCSIQNGKDESIVPFTISNETCNLNSTSGETIYNGNCQNVPHSPTTRTQQYDFVPISDGCHSPANFNAKSPLGFGHRGQSPSKARKPVMMGGSLQTSPTSHSTAASPFVSPRNTPVPRSRLCPRPIPKLNGRKKRTMLSLGMTEPCPKQFAVPNDQKMMNKPLVCGPGMKYCQPMSAPPSPSIMSTQFNVNKSQHQHGLSGMPNGNSNLSLNFLPNVPFRDSINGELSQPLSADPLSSEVSQFFQESVVSYRSQHDTSFRSQSVPLKQGVSNMVNMLSYNNTPVGSVPPTPVPQEFCDFGTLADTCDISKAGLNPESLDKIYDAIDSSNDVLNPNVTSNLMNTNETYTNGCNPLSDQQLLTEDQLSSLIPTENELLHRDTEFNQTFSGDNGASDVVEFLKRTNSIEFDLSDIVTDKSKYYMSRSVPSTPLPYKRTAPILQLDARRSREIFPSDSFTNLSNGISSKSVPSTPQLPDERNMFSYSNRDFLINGNSVSEETCSAGAGPGPQPPLVDGDAALGSPLQDMLREDILAPLTPNTDLLADLDKMDATPYVDL